MRLVVFGWGNDARGDDALGVLLLRRIADAFPEVEAIEDYQLQIEHALDLEGADVALFIDASRGLTTPFAFYEIAASAAPTPTTHALSPQAVLDVYAKVRCKTPPPAFVLALRGESFELGEDLSPAGVEALEAATAFCETLLAARALGAWRGFAERTCSKMSSGAV